MPDIIHDTPRGHSPGAAADGGERARQQAIRQLERKRRFWTGTAVSGIVIAVLVVIWALAEYHNAGGWPARGFGQSSGISEVWNFWIVYPVGAWLVLVAANAWRVYRIKPLS